jgi:FKBP-type peptidyl-prolyl cis-trans isomerase
VKVSDLLPGLAEGVQMMTSDSKGFFLVPPSLSFGTAHWPDGVAKNSPLIYRVTLHEIDPVAAP